MEMKGNTTWRAAVRTSVLAHLAGTTSEPGWTDRADNMAEGNRGRDWVRTAQRPEGVSDWLLSWLRVTKSTLARCQTTPKVAGSSVSKWMYERKAPPTLVKQQTRLCSTAKVCLDWPWKLNWMHPELQPDLWPLWWSLWKCHGLPWVSLAKQRFNRS